MSCERRLVWTAAVESGLASRGEDAELLRAILRTVVDLLDVSAVPPEEICAPATGARAQARVAIMSAPPYFQRTGSTDLE